MEKSNDPFDVELGSRVRAQRLLIGMTQRELAIAMAVSFQQLQKYESGDNRMSANKVYLAAAALRVTVGYLMGEPTPTAKDHLDVAIGLPGTNQLFDAWRRIDSERDRRILISLARKLAAPVKA
ncbi:helix-turn-helix domain-containing protein [Sphingomonas sp. 2378]|uniref:helix-turn-helix domain-containing protein n=1 Tax=Sphingomonas sp. 2378 TaxID=1219748 RepID=UPI00311AF353